jgi:hypothetical protein
MPTPVIIPQNAIVIYYNCHYMPAICQNYVNWLATPRGQGRSLVTILGGGTQVFSFDIFNPMSDRRGRAMCPDNWKNFHTCPERNAAGALIQPPIMPGPWGSTLRETIDPLQINEIEADYRLNLQTGERTLLQRSGRYYTCEEWPPRRYYSRCLTCAPEILIVLEVLWKGAQVLLDKTSCLKATAVLETLFARQNGWTPTALKNLYRGTKQLHQNKVHRCYHVISHILTRFFRLARSSSCLRWQETATHRPSRRPDHPNTA